MERHVVCIAAQCSVCSGTCGIPSKWWPVVLATGSGCIGQYVIRSGGCFRCSFVCFACQVKDEWQDRLALSAEDYLHALISMVNELVSV